MREPQDKEIDGTVYTIRPLAGMKSVTFLPRLNKILGPAIASLIDAKGVTGENLKQALTALGDRLDEKEMEVITKTLLGDCTYQPGDGNKGGLLLPVFDLVFQGQPETAFKLLAFALEVNYSGFFPVLGQLAAYSAVKASALTSPTNSPKSGTAGA